MISVTTPMAAQPASASTKPTGIGKPSLLMNSAPSTPPSMPNCPAVKLITREAANMML